MYIVKVVGLVVRSSDNTGKLECLQFRLKWILGF